MKIDKKYDEQGNMLLKIYNNDDLIVDQVTKVIPDSEIPMPPKKDTIIQAAKSLFYLPNQGDDLIQTCIFNNKNYFERIELDRIRPYLNKESVVIDIGANIGNHTLFFANECNVKKIYSLEPVPYTFEILVKNIEINHLEDRVTALRLGTSDTCCNAAIKCYDLKNLGGTNLRPYESGDIKLVTVDSLDIKEKIDLIKIDVESMDYETLCGAKNTIEKNKPVIVLESFENEQKKTFPLLEEYGYEQALALGNFEFVYTPQNK